MSSNNNSSSSSSSSSNNNRKIAEFPGVEAKLQKPAKQSAFERQRAEAEAKRQREAAETAAVYEDFVKSFNHDEDDAAASAHGSRPSQRLPGGPPGRPGGAAGGHAPFGGGVAGRRHFGIPSNASGIKSGPGSLGPSPSSFGKKRTFDGFQQPANRRDREEPRAILGFADDDDDDDDDAGPTSISKAFNASDDEEESKAAAGREERAISRPTLRLSNLPPGTSPAVIKALVPPNLTVENVKILPPAGPGGMERKSLAAIVTLSQETAATDIDAAVSALQNRYLGFGFYLSLHRHLSSAAISASLATPATSTSASHPFGAKPVAQPGPPQGPHSLGHGRGFAPPSSYAPNMGPVNRSGILHVPVQPLKNVRQLRMIHKVLEGVLEHGPEFEALLMARPDVQRDEKWAWIWDARSPGGIWYRWRLWEVITGNQSRKGRGKYVPLFEGSSAWKAPDQSLSFEYTTAVDEFVSDSDYNSSDDDEFEDEPQAKIDAANNDQEDTFLNPIDKAKLTHLLARLPTTLSRIRKGDVARITAFAITRASRGSDEIADIIVANIEKPFTYTSANPANKQEGRDRDNQDEDSRQASPAAEEKAASEVQDTSAAKLIGLYVISDVLSSSSTSGIRHAWRYRQLFEGGLRRRRVFEGLGMMAERMNWGRLRAEKWKRSISLVLNLWEGWCVFPAETHESFVRSFESPPQLKKEEKVDEAAKKGRWKTLDAPAARLAEDSGFRPVGEAGVGGSTTSLEDASGAAAAGADRLVDSDGFEGDYTDDEYTDDEELDMQALEEDDIDGEPIIERDLAGLSMVDKEVEMGGTAGSDATGGGEGGEKTEAGAKSVSGFRMSSTPASRKRMRAVDMFADSDQEDAG